MSKMNIPIEAEFIQVMINPVINNEHMPAVYTLRKADELYVATGDKVVMMFTECPSDSKEATYKTLKGISLKLIYKN